MHHANEQDGGAESRVHAEKIIASYPNIAGDELKQVLRYLRKEATALDCAAIASNEAILKQYRQLCHDHYLDRPRPAVLALIGFGVIVLIAALIWIGWFADY